MSEIAAIGGIAAAPAANAGTKPAGEAAAHEDFERLLLGQLTKELVETAMPDDPAAAVATGAYRQMLPDALTEALMSGGGIGLAAKLAEGKASS